MGDKYRDSSFYELVEQADINVSPSDHISLEPRRKNVVDRIKGDIEAFLERNPLEKLVEKIFLFGDKHYLLRGIDTKRGTLQLVRCSQSGEVLKNAQGGEIASAKYSIHAPEFVEQAEQICQKSESTEE